MKMKRIRELLVDLHGCKGDLDNVEFLTEVLTNAYIPSKGPIGINSNINIAIS